MKLIYIFIIVWFFYINGWAPFIDSILGSVGSILDLLLYLLLGLLAIAYILCLFGMKTLKKDHPDFYNFMFFANTFVMGAILSYALLVFVYVKQNFNDSNQVFAYSLQDIKNAKFPFILQSPKDLLSARGEFVSAKLDTYEEYEKFKKVQSIHPYYSNKETDGYYDDYLMTKDEYEAEEREERYQDAMLMEGGNNDPSPGVHEVSSYSRTDGTYVEGYERTNPDGIEENNFSYRGK